MVEIKSVVSLANQSASLRPGLEMGIGNSAKLAMAWLPIKGGEEVRNTLSGPYDWNLDKGPDALGNFFFFFFLAKISVTSSLRQVRLVIFRSIKFCQGLPNFTDSVSLPRSRTNFCQAWNLTDLSIYTQWVEGKCQLRKFDLYF